MKKYTYQLCSHALEILPLASDLASRSWKYRSLVLQVLASDVIDVLLPELITCLVLLQVEIPLLMHHSDWLQLFNPLLDALDGFNKLIRDIEKEDIEDLSWPGIFDTQSYRIPVPATPEDSVIIRECDLFNHNHDGGLWIVINDKVYDVQDFSSQAPCDGELLQRYSGKDATQVCLDTANPYKNLLSNSAGLR